MMIEILWRRHFHPGVTGSYHGDMAHAFKAMLADSDCYPAIAGVMWRSIRIHQQVENNPDYCGGRRWFCEAFGKAVQHG